jgi:putative ABC transport system permease protein
VAALVSILTLALGVGAGTAVFAVLHAVLLRPLDLADPASLVQITALNRQGGGRETGFSLPELRDWQERTHAFAAVGALGSQTMTLVENDGARTVRAALVSPDLFAMLGAPLALGRPLLAADARLPVVVVGESLWRSRFGGAPGAIDQRLTLNGRAYSVVGVAARGLELPGPPVDVWLPLEALGEQAPPQWQMRGYRAFSLLARLRPGVGLEEAAADASGVARWLESTYPRFSAGVEVTVTPLRERLVAPIRPALLLVFAAVLSLYAITCLNLLHLALAAVAGRARELAIRAALGSGPWRLMGQLVAESATIGVAGGSVGILAAAGAIRLLAAGGASVPLVRVRVDWEVIAFGVLLTILATALFTVLAALSAVRARPAAVLQDTRMSSSRKLGRVRRWGVVSQLSLAVVLTAVAILLSRSLWQLVHEETGVETAQVLTMKVNLDATGQDGPGAREAFVGRLLASLAGIGGVRSAAAISSLPPATSQMHTTLAVENSRAGGPQEVPVDIVAVSEQAFAALRIPVLRGRPFTAGEIAGIPSAVIVSERAALRLFPDRDALGERLQIGPSRPGHEPPQVIGVVGDVRYAGLGAAPDGAVYLPFTQRPFRTLYLVLSTERRPGIVSDVRRALLALDPARAVSDLRPLDAVVEDAAAGPRLRTLLLLAFAVLAMVLSGVGLYGVVALGVAERQGEIGVRLALGATPGEIRAMIVGEGLRLAAAGTVIGIAAAVAAARVLRGLLYGISTVDPLSLLATGGALLVLTVLATVGPARGAARESPTALLATGRRRDA